MSNQEQITYWRQQLQGTSPLDLPTDRPRPPEQSQCRARHILLLETLLRDQLAALSQRESATLSMTLLAAFKVLLARYTSQDDIAVGTPIANRNRAEIEGLMGSFANTLVLRTDLSGNPTFLEALQRVRKVTLRAYAHQDIPFETLIEALQPERDLSRTPFFQVMFLLQNAPRTSGRLADLQQSALKQENTTARPDLALSVHDTGQGLRCVMEYSTDLFEAATIARMMEHFKVLLESIVAHPSQRIADLALLTAAEREQRLVSWNTSTLPSPPGLCAHQFVEARAEMMPDAISIFEGEAAFTYGELNRRANQLAHYLRTIQVDLETPVAVCMQRSFELVVGLLGVLKAGGAYVPLDPSLPPERLAWMIRDVGASVVLTQAALVDGISVEKGEIICLDRHWQAFARQPTNNGAWKVEPSNLAYVIYTSGSTGRPKGVAIEHVGLCNLMIWHQQAFTITSADHATHLSGLGFDAAVWELWPYLASGASVSLLDNETRVSPVRLLRWLVEHAITICFMPTPLAEEVLSLTWPQEAHVHALLVGGDHLHVYPSPRLTCTLVNNYGPTESSVVATSGPVLPRTNEASPPGIGRPIANTQIYILDTHMQPVPVGVSGELYIGGMSLARGYMHRPDLTAERFLPNPFATAEQPGERLYRTGDIARYQVDGTIAFSGRADHQVKIRGFRIELGEIEAALATHPDIRECAAIVHEDATGKHLAAYVVGNEDATLDNVTLCQYLRGMLPEYMIPSFFVVLDALPLNPNGKVDRKVLAAMKPGRRMSRR